MNTGQLTFWSSGAWLIPLFLVATLVVLYFLARRWRADAEYELKELRRAQRAFQGERRTLAATIASFQPDDPEPFGPRAAALQARLAELDAQMAQVERAHVSVQERAAPLSRAGGQAVIGAPFIWFQLRRDLAGIRTDLAAQQHAMQEAAAAGQELVRMGWQTAQKARQVQKTYRQVSGLYGELEALHLQGPALEAAEAQLAENGEALEALPRYLFDSDEQTVLAQSDKAAIVEAHQALGEIEPALAGLLSRAESWRHAQAGAAKRVAGMEQAVSDASLAFDAAPPGLDLSGEREQVRSLEQIARNLHATLTRLETESIVQVSEEAARVTALAHETESRLKRSRQMLASLENLLPELGEGLKSLSAVFALLGKSEIHPIIWSQSRAQLSALTREVNALPGASQPRTPEKLENDVRTAEALRARLNELLEHSASVAQQHGELVGLLSQNELSQGGEWLARARKLAQRAQGYDPENWPRSDGLAALPGEIQSLEKTLQQVLAGDIHDPLDELETGPRLEATHRLAQAQQALSVRLNNIQSRLGEIQQAEKTAHEQLDETRNAFNQIALLIRSSDQLQEITGQEPSRFQNQLQGLSAELEQRGRGTVEKKARQVRELAARIEQQANTWLDALSKSLEARRKEIAETLTGLERVTALDEPAVAEARRLLGEGPAFTSSTGSKAQLRLGEQALEFRRRSEYGQQLSAAARALQDGAGQVAISFRDANQSRDAAKKYFDEVSAWFRTNRAWPPTTVMLNNERQELARIEEQWEGLKTQRLKAASLAAQLSTLAGRYEALNEKVEQLVNQANSEHERAEEQENEVNSLMDQWRSQGELHQANPEASESIRKLLAELERELNLVRQQYRQGQKNYAQVLQALNVLARKARYEQVQIDAKHSIDVHGRVIAG